MSEKTPSVIALSRQNLPLLRAKENNFADNLSKKGAYILKDIQNPDITLIASGSEVALAINVSEELINENIQVRVVSMPSMELFEKQSAEYRSLILDKTKNIFMEAGSAQTWNKWIKKDDTFIGLDNFGVSGPGHEVFSHFNISIDRVKKEIVKIIKN